MGNRLQHQDPNQTSVAVGCVQQLGSQPVDASEAEALSDSFLPLAGWILAAGAAFDLAYTSAHTGYFIVVYAFALLRLSGARTGRQAFYGGLLAGLLIAAVKLAFFWRIFAGGAIALWLVYALWIGLFVALAQLCRQRFQGIWAFVPIPFLWCGIEYFRSELYYLRFSWLSQGFAFGTAPGTVPIHYFGEYGVGFIFTAIACVGAWYWKRSRSLALTTMLLGSGLLYLIAHIGSRASQVPARLLHVAGVQLEFPTEPEVVLRLTELAREHPEAELLVLSEYTFSEPIPKRILNWCRSHQKYLIVGGKDPVKGGQYFNTAFVISPVGQIVFRQAKSVPIQFFKDGLPAREQTVWNSPWGKLGLCICYDLSYSRVSDRLIRLGAEALVVPTMDMADWGRAQHQLHARVAPLRATEYNVPIFRLASSGISQIVDASGLVTSTAPFPGEGATLSGVLELREPGRLPVDRYLAPFSTAVTAAVAAMVLLAPFLRRASFFSRPLSDNQPAG